MWHDGRLDKNFARSVHQEKRPTLVAMASKAASALESFVMSNKDWQSAASITASSGSNHPFLRPPAARLHSCFASGPVAQQGPIGLGTGAIKKQNAVRFRRIIAACPT